MVHVTVCAGLHFDPLTTMPRVQLTDMLAMDCSWPVSTARGTSESENEKKPRNFNIRQSLTN